MFVVRVMLPALLTVALVVTGCAPRDHWVQPHSDRYYADREACMRESYVGPMMYGQDISEERFAVCMKARGWPNQ